MRFSQREWIFDDDSLEESVFVEKFKIQDRKQEPEDSTVKMSREQERSSRFSMSFAQEDASLEVVEEDAVADVVASAAEANQNWYKESLINQIQSNAKPFGLFGGRRESTKPAKANEAEGLWTIAEEPGAGRSQEVMAAAENFRQTEDDETRNKIGAPYQKKVAHPATEKHSLAPKQAQDPKKPEQVPSTTRKSINYFKNLSSQSQSRQKLRADRKSAISQTSEENFRITERATNESKRHPHPGILEDQADANNHSFR